MLGQSNTAKSTITTNLQDQGFRGISDAKLIATLNAIVDWASSPAMKRLSLTQTRALSTDYPNIIYITTATAGLFILDESDNTTVDDGLNTVVTTVGNKRYKRVTGTIASVTGLQTALDAKAPLTSPTFTGTLTVPNILANSATISPTELSYLDNVSSNLQTQLDAKLPFSGGTMTGVLKLKGGKWIGNGNGDIAENNVLGSNTLGMGGGAGGYNTIIGHNGGYFVDGGNNTAIGANAMFGTGSGANYNTALGVSSLYAISSGDYNTGVGWQSLYGTTTGSYNSAIGYQAGSALRNGNYNVIVGNPTLGTTWRDRSNRMYIANNAGLTYMVGDSSGRVGINTFSPSYQLSVNGNVGIDGNTYVRDSLYLFAKPIVHKTFLFASPTALATQYNSPDVGYGNIQIGGSVLAKTFYNNLEHVFSLSNPTTDPILGLSYPGIYAYRDFYFNTLSTGVAHLSVSGKLSSSLIINNDVSSSAAIAQSKIANLSDTLATRLKLTGGIMTGALETSNRITAGSGFSASGGGLYLKYTSNAASRSWRIVNDFTAYGALDIQRSTTQTGSTYTTVLYLGVNDNIGVGTSSPATTAILDVASTSKGVRFSPMTRSQRVAISTPATGLMVYQTDGVENYYVNTSGGWKSLEKTSVSTVTKTANYTVTLTDYTIRGNATSGNITFTLPTAASAYDSNTLEGKVYVFKRTDGTANTFTIAANGAELIDGSNTKTITTQYASITVQSNGTSWDIIYN